MAETVVARAPACHDFRGRDPADPLSIPHRGPADRRVHRAHVADALAATHAGVCLVSAKFAPSVPEGTVALVCKEPYRAYAKVVTRLYPGALRPQSSFGESGVSPHALIHPTARLGDGVGVDPGAVVRRRRRSQQARGSAPAA